MCCKTSSYNASLGSAGEHDRCFPRDLGVGSLLSSHVHCDNISKCHGYSLLCVSLIAQPMVRLLPA